MWGLGFFFCWTLESVLNWFFFFCRGTGRENYLCLFFFINSTTKPSVFCLGVNWMLISGNKRRVSLQITICTVSCRRFRNADGEQCRHHHRVRLRVLGGDDDGVEYVGLNSSDVAPAGRVWQQWIVYSMFQVLCKAIYVFAEQDWSWDVCWWKRLNSSEQSTEMYFSLERDFLCLTSYVKGHQCTVVLLFGSRFCVLDLKANSGPYFSAVMPNIHPLLPCLLINQTCILQTLFYLSQFPTQHLWCFDFSSFCIEKIWEWEWYNLVLETSVQNFRFS